MKYLEARDHLFGIVRDANLGIPINWQDVVGETPATESTWARVWLAHSTGEQASLSCENGMKRWRSAGTLVIQIYEPVANGRRDGYNIAQKLVDALRNYRHDNLWLRRPQMAEYGSQGNYSQTRVTAFFEYDDYGSL